MLSMLEVTWMKSLGIHTVAEQTNSKSKVFSHYFPLITLLSASTVMSLFFSPHPAFSWEFLVASCHLYLLCHHYLEVQLVLLHKFPTIV